MTSGAICPKCKYGLDSSTNLKTEGNPPPSPGDYGLCFKCGALLVFNDDLQLALPKDEVQLLLEMDAGDRALVIRAQTMIREMRKSHAEKLL